MATIGEKSGALDRSESAIIRNLMKLEVLKVRDIMTPRRVILTANQDMELMDFYKSQRPLPFSRIPIYEGKSDDVIGMILKDELLQELVEDNDHAKLKSIVRPIVAVKDDQSLQELFDTLTTCLLYTSPSPRDLSTSRMPSSA